jgi:hypothetical protein
VILEVVDSMVFERRGRRSVLQHIYDPTQPRQHFRCILVWEKERLFIEDLTVGLVGMDSLDDWEGELPFCEIF